MRSKNQKIEHPLLREKGISLFMKREDLLHPTISGNKFRKLKYNLVRAKELGHDSLLTFGGAFSNHIAATAYAGKEHKFRTIGVIRGKELEGNFSDNPTLQLALENGMRFKFISRADYRSKEDGDFLKDLTLEFGRHYLLPEGGTNLLAVKGCEEILTDSENDFNLICCPVGTGGTVSGIINASNERQYILGFSALKGNFLKEDIRKFASKKNWDLNARYHFGGFAKVTPELIRFINDFKQITQIQLDPIYTGKMVFGIFDLLKEDRFERGTRILAVHTGGLQGIEGINQKLRKKREPQII